MKGVPKGKELACADVDGITTEGDVRLLDGTLLQVDFIVCATGYCVSLPFLDYPDLISSDNNVHNLYKRVFYVHDTSLAFIGTPYDLIPPFQVFEYQSRWAAKVFAKKLSLPCREVMVAAAEEWHKEMAAQPTKRDSLRLRTPAYCNQLASLTQSRGYWTQVLTRRLWWTLMTMATRFVSWVKSGHSHTD
eukprot:NODE_1103_length_1283_cov_91.676661_g902_i0.p1 GENE.NODE_1103_length_1283_cov_91.676661_g902_i0~~NODE_1103_length_1283_cov_91.676661_g902_i0.p1  ORF type:complete len:190 (+),score=36.29 NODE_1103_length_1283_cov_91.676661_g902_i0:648-1217(+)